MVIQKLTYLLALFTYHTIHSISLFLITRKKHNLFFITSLLGLKLIRDLGFAHVVEKLFLATLAEVYSISSFIIFLLQFPYLFFQKILAVFWNTLI